MVLFKIQCHFRFNMKQNYRENNLLKQSTSLYKCYQNFRLISYYFSVNLKLLLSRNYYQKKIWVKRPDIDERNYVNKFLFYFIHIVNAILYNYIYIRELILLTVIKLTFATTDLAKWPYMIDSSYLPISIHNYFSKRTSICHLLFTA